MAQWKKVIVSGSQAELAGITGSNLTEDRIVFSTGAGALTTDDILIYKNNVLSGSVFSGSFVGDGSGLTGVASILTLSGSNNTGSVDLKTETLILTGSNKGIVTTVTGSGANEVIFELDNIVSIQALEVSQSLNVSGSIFATGSVVDFTQVGVISGSTFSGSFVGDGSGLTGVTAEWDGSRSGSAVITGSFTVSGSTGTVVDFTATDAISGSTFSGSFVGDGSGLTGIASTLNITGSVGSGSTSLLNDTLFLTGSAKGISTDVSASVVTFTLQDTVSINRLEVSQSLNVSGSIFATGSVVDFSQVGVISGSIFSGSFVGDGSGLTGLGTTLNITGSVGSGSTNLLNDTLFLTGSAKGINTNVSASVVEFSLADTVSINRLEVSQSLNVSGSIFATGSVVDFTQVGVISGSTFSGSFVGDGSGLTGVTAEWDGTHSGSAIISGSFTVSGSAGTVVDFTATDAISGSIFSGSFVGDGSGLTGIASTLNITGSIGSGSTDLLTDKLFLTGSAKGITTQVSASVVTFTLQDTVSINRLEVSQSLNVSGSIFATGSVVDFTQVGVISGSVFSGSFVGDGSGLTGVGSVIKVSGSGTLTDSGSITSSSISNGNIYFRGSDNQIRTSVSGSVVDFSLQDNVHISGALTVSGTLSGSTGYFEFIQVSGSVINDLTASYAMKAETTAINSGFSQAITPATASWTINHGLGTEYPLVEVWDGTTNKVIIPDEITSINLNTIQIDFTNPVEGHVNVSRAGHVVSASFENRGVSQQVTPASDTWTITHNLGTKYPHVTVWESGSEQIIQPNTVTSIDENTVVLTFTQPVEGYVNIGRAGHIISGSTLWTSLTGPANVIADLVITGSLTVSGSKVDFSNATVISGSTFSGSFVGDGSGLTGVTAEWDGTHSGSAVISGSFTVSGSAGTVVDFTATDAISGSVFSGSFVGDGSGLTGIATSLNISASNATSGSINLKSAGLIVSGTINEIDVDFNDSTNTLQIGLPQDVTIQRDLTVNGDFRVFGTASYIETTDLLVADQFILLASGSTTQVDGGIIIQSSSISGSGLGFGLDASANRWALQTGLTSPAVSMTPDAYMVSVEFSSGSLPTTPAYGGNANGYGNLFVDTENGEIYIWA